MYGVPTATFYQPLTQTLDKSMVRNPILELSKSRAYEQVGATSRISRRMRSLSPEQANYIKRSTILPVDKDLIPTDHLWRVKGKQFSAVNIQVKQGAPIPANMIRIPPGGRGGVVTTQTVYQARPKSGFGNLNNTRSITNLRTVYPPRQIQAVATNVSPIVSRIIQQRPSVVEIRRPASPVRLAVQPNIPTIQSVRQSRAIVPLNTISSVNRVNTSNNQYNQISQQIGNSSAFVSDQTKTRESEPLNQYYNSQMRSDYGDASKKGKYKYNFFSSLDQAINTKCGSCGANQIIASKPLSSWE